MKVLVKEKIADTGVDLLRSQFDVDLGLEMSDEELREAIGGYDAILIRSATKMTPELIDLATNLKVIGSAGNPPHDQSRKFAILVIVLTTLTWFVVPAAIALAVLT